ncbi:hypothetical protein D1007_23654 [Hordeum vulgare]|nr:hypothetical protein D1007_23654 [Hordeum vulgare]
MANSIAPASEDLAATAWPRTGNGPIAPLLVIPVSRIIHPSIIAQDSSIPTPPPPTLPTQVDFEALCALLSKARTAAASGLPQQTVRDTGHAPSTISPGSPPPPPRAHDQIKETIDVSPPPSDAQLPSAFRPYDSSNASALDIDTPAFPFSAGSSSDPDPHEVVLRKLRHSAKRSTDKNMSLRRSSCLAAEEPQNFTDMTSKVVRARAACISANDVQKPLRDVIYSTQLDIREAPPASATALAELAELCGTDVAAAASVANVDDNTDVEGAHILP